MTPEEARDIAARINALGGDQGYAVPVNTSGTSSSIRLFGPNGVETGWLTDQIMRTAQMLSDAGVLTHHSNESTAEMDERSLGGSRRWLVYIDPTHDDALYNGRLERAPAGDPDESLYIMFGTVSPEMRALRLRDLYHAMQEDSRPATLVIHTANGGDEFYNYLIGWSTLPWSRHAEVWHTVRRPQIQRTLDSAIPGIAAWILAQREGEETDGK